MTEKTKNNGGKLPIVCGTDFSPNAIQAATAAAALALRAGRNLVLVHAADEFDRFDEDKEELAAYLQPRRTQLRAEADRLRKTGVWVEEKLLTGKLAERAILDLVEEEPAALVVVSSISKAAFDRWTLGTVSESVAESVASPTLVVRSAAPFESWARGERPLKIFLAADFASVTEAALQWVGDLRALGPCEVVVAHLDWQMDECERLGFGEVETYLENPAEVQLLLERDVRARCEQQLGQENVRVMVEPALDRPDARLIELAREAQSDLIVVGTHQRRGLGRVGHLSMSRSVLRHAPMSVACVPGRKGNAADARLPSIRRVLVATDFSKVGNGAVPHACSLLRDGGTVILLHVTSPVVAPSSLSLETTETRQEHAARLEEASAALRALIPSEAAGRGVTSEVAVIEHDDPGAAICQAAERSAADVICIGSRGRAGLSAALLGSTAQEVMAQSRRPLLLVRPPLE